jgi:hypothetical protein
MFERAACLTLVCGPRVCVCLCVCCVCVSPVSSLQPAGGAAGVSACTKTKREAKSNLGGWSHVTCHTSHDELLEDRKFTHQAPSPKPTTQSQPTNLHQWQTNQRPKSPANHSQRQRRAIQPCTNPHQGPCNCCSACVPTNKRASDSI